jgi:vitamin B12 transporter
MTSSPPINATLASPVLALASPALSFALAFALATPGASAQSLSEKPIGSIIVTATRTPQPSNEVLSDTVVIEQAEIARASSLADLLGRQRGIEIARNGGAGSNASVFIRGANANQNVVLVDGVRIGSSTTGAANWSAIPLSSIDHIEIVYGPLSTLYGADAIGGVIHIFTKKGGAKPLLAASIKAGSNQTREVEASISGRAGDDGAFSYALSAGQQQSDGFSATLPSARSYNPDRDGYDRQSAAGQFTLELAAGHAVGLTFLHSRLDAQYDNGPSSFDARSLQQLDNLALFSRNQLLPGWTSQFQVAQAEDQSSNASSSTSTSQINTRQTSVSWQNDIEIGRDTLQLLFERRDEDVLSSSAAALTRGRTTDSVAASYHLKRGAQLASVSVRNDDSSQFGSASTGALAYGYRLSSALRASASASTSFRAPTFNDLYYPGFGLASNRPEEGRNVEAGLHFDDGHTQWSATYYRNRVTDLLVTAAVCPIETASHPKGCSYNIDQAQLAGWTWSVRRRIGPFQIKGNLDLQDPRNETTGKQLARRAKRHANLGIDYGAGAFDGGAEWQLSSQRFDDSANLKPLGGYGLLNLHASYQVAPDWSLLLRWNNVTDKRHELASNYATEGSNVFVGLRYGIK